VTAQGDGWLAHRRRGKPARDAILWHDKRASDGIGQWQGSDIDNRL
jgi:hypothetical protein